MRSIQIGDKNTWATWGLYLKEIEIGLPEPKTSYIDIPFGNGTIDLSEAFTNEVVYNDRELSFEFDFMAKHTERASVIADLASNVHGQKRKIFLPDDQEHYYLGRLSINQYKTSTIIGNLSLTAVCEPYKYKKDVTVIEKQVAAAELSVNCNNSRKKVIPTFELTSETVIKFKDKIINANAGKHRFSNVIFEEGENIVTLSSAAGGAVKISYQEGVL